MNWNRKQATFTYFPDGLELQMLENDLEESVRFWSRDVPFDEHEVSLLFFQSDIKTDEEKRRSVEAVKIKLQCLRRTLPIPDGDEEFLAEMRQSGRKLKIYVNEIEKYCTSIKFGVVDEVVAKDLYRVKFARQWMKVEPYVQAVRRKYGGNAGILERFQEAVTEWSKPEQPDKRHRYGISTV